MPVPAEQPEGVFSSVLTVQLSAEQKRAALANAAKDPDSYLAAAYSFGMDVPHPPLQFWRGHSQLTWLAFRLTDEVAELARAGPAVDRNAEIPDNLLNQKVEEALHATTMAQEVNPDNGALWIAESVLQFTRGSDFDGISALLSAAAKPNWNSGAADLFAYMIEQRGQQGLPRFDATMNIWSVPWLPGLRVPARTREHLLRIMADTVEHRDSARFGEFASLLRGLQEGVWQSGERYNVFQALPFYDQPSCLFAAMAAALGVDLFAYGDPDSNVGHQARVAIGDRVLQEYLRDHLNSGLATELLETDAEYHRTHPRWRTCSLADGPASLSGRIGSMAILLFGLLAGALLIELPFRMRTQPFIVEESRPWRQGWTWLLTFVVAITCAAIVVFLAIDYAMRPAQFTTFAPKPALLTPTEALWAALLLTTAVATWRMIAERSRPATNSFRGWLWVLGAAYVLTVFMTAMLRETAVSWRIWEVTTDQSGVPQGSSVVFELVAWAMDSIH
jgi:hypothetical protein